LPPSGQALGESEWILKSFSLSFTALKILRRVMCWGSIAGLRRGVCWVWGV